MLVESWAALHDGLRSAWGLETRDPVDLRGWIVHNPARGQCAVTALVINDQFGGDLMIAEVSNSGGTRQGVYYWNRIVVLDVDLAREQFRHGERLGSGTVLSRPTTEPTRCSEQYRLLRDRVLAALASLG
jgi:hypothetical protein